MGPGLLGTRLGWAEVPFHQHLQGTFLIPRALVLILEGRLPPAGAEPEKKWGLLWGLENCSVLGWLLQEEQPSVSSRPCRELERVCPWELGQPMGVGWVILNPPAGVLIAPMLSGQCPCWTRSSVI